MKTTLIASILVLLGGPALAGSPWTRAAGSGYVQAAFYVIPAHDELFGSEDPFVTERRITDVTLEAYAEHGLTDGWTLLGAVPLKFLEAGDPSDAPSLVAGTEAGSLTALGNVRLGVRRAITRGAWVSAAQLDVEMPTGDFDAPTGLRSGIDGFAFVPSVSVGRGRARDYWFAHLGVAWRNRGYGEQLRAGVEYGRRVFGDDWLFVAGLEVLQSFDDDGRRDAILGGARADELTNLATGLYVDDQEVVSPVLKAIYTVDPTWGASFTVQGGFAGKQVARSPFLGVAVFAIY